MNQNSIIKDVEQALDEDLNGLGPIDGDITAALISNDVMVKASILTREDCTICGIQWATETFRQVNPDITVNWLVADGDVCEANQIFCELSGSARSILTAERTALNFLQTLSGTATTAKAYVDLLAGSGITLLDTRKTIPGMRMAQKYAVKCGGAENHRIGLFDAFLIKENHILACGSIANAVKQARQNMPQAKVEVEVESLEELKQAIDARADIVMLDNFDHEMLSQAVLINQKTVKLEVSGNITEEKLHNLRGIGIDFVSSGALTKDVKSIDLSLRIN
ncbi:carboxylating nicotinate-nucleotide diphosphorylase [Aliiglaciecola lipolytica]|uniref:carboxylating nicotinate-nucleotide diphosphorylase n=1 Tax=Aliiglaciecola lipolytica TaxID=477689 RepID=UPI001C0954E0|nr:carboxylating nicotinate-nucleotide diphosphorylase [Aliiglaciecola lipolytica]MBU2876923.1 carboxylating nicotinate-nucleotide diphosphorylase [Aliiglaciecola lipolytica]